MKVELTGFLYWKKDPYSGKHSFEFLHWDCRTWDAKDRQGRVFIKEQSIAVEVPDNFDPVPGQIAALEEQKRKARADFQRTVTEIDRQIQSLLAIEHVQEDSHE